MYYVGTHTLYVYYKYLYLNKIAIIVIITSGFGTEFNDSGVISIIYIIGQYIFFKCSFI